MKSSVDWDQLRAFLAVARFGGLSAASKHEPLSAPTLGRHVLSLERSLGQRLFRRHRDGYTLTAAGQRYFSRAIEVETAVQSFVRDGNDPTARQPVRISAGHWMAAFLANHLNALLKPGDNYRLELSTADTMTPIQHREADIGIRNRRPSNPSLACRKVSKVAFAAYSARNSDCMTWVRAIDPVTPSARWVDAHVGVDVTVLVSDPRNALAIVAGGQAQAVLPCFVGDLDQRLTRSGPVIDELTHDQWLVSHQEGRHDPIVRAVLDRVGNLIREHRPLFAGDIEALAA